MESDRLYRVKREDVEKLKELLTACFARDPLYCKLIPDEDTRKRLMPELFECDMEEFFETCEIYADSPEINGIIVVDDESEPYNPVHYLNSKWTDQLHQEERLHIIYLAVRPRMQHHGISALLLNEAIDYADRHRQMISLETHNEKNVAFYQHFGFKVFGVVEKHFDLKQYCMIREV